MVFMVGGIDGSRTIQLGSCEKKTVGLTSGDVRVQSDLLTGYAPVQGWASDYSNPAT